MLLQFAVENYTCFAEKQVLSLMAVEGEEHPEGQAIDVPGVGKVLRSVVLYGPNASGKSNLVRAFEAVRSMAVDGVPPGGKLPVKPHRLDPARLKEPSSFELELLVDGVRYSYGIRATTTTVVEEWLDRVEGDEHVSIFDRKDGAIVIGPGLELDEQRRAFYGFVAEGTRPEQPFLAELRTRNATELNPVFENLHHSEALEADDLLDPAYIVGNFFRPWVREGFSEVLRDAGTGIEEVRLVAESPRLQARIDAGEKLSEEERRGAVRLAFLHRDATGGTTALELGDLSGGTQRLFLLVIPYALVASETPTLFLDELDRSFHTDLTGYLMRLLNREEGENQYVFTTHDTNLLDAGVFGRDAIWFVEKDSKGASHLYSLVEYRRDHLDGLKGRLEHGYLQGRFGALPRIRDPGPAKRSAG